MRKLPGLFDPRKRTAARLTAALLLFTLPAGLYAAARADNIPLCLFLLGINVLTSVLVIIFK